MLTRDHELQQTIDRLHVCFFVSGAVGLIYEILWLRKLILVFGSTVHAVSTVLTVFFGGLALGSWLFGRLIDRREAAGVRWYAALEAAAGLYALATIPLFDAIQHVYVPIYRASGFSPAVLVGASFACAAAILLVPTTLLGGTLPVLTRYLVRAREERGVRLAGLYGINTAGAVTGTVLIYAVGLPVLGYRVSLQSAAVLSLGVGALAFVLDRHLARLGFRPVPAGAPAPALDAPTTERDRRLFLALGLAGFAAMVYEVAWTRALSLIVGGSIYAFGIMLATFLAGLAGGSLWARRWLARGPVSAGRIAGLELLLGVCGLLSILVFSQLPQWFVTLWPLTGQAFPRILALQVALSASAMIVPTVLMGLAFPLAVALLTDAGRVGRRVGGAYAVNTLGGILGSFLSGFALIPWLGLPWTIVVAALANGLAGMAVWWQVSARPVWQRAVLSAGGLAAAVVVSQRLLLPTWQQGVFAAGIYMNPGSYQGQSVRLAAQESTLLYYRDSLNTTVSVHQLGPTLFLKVGGKTDASNGVDMSTQVLSAHIPMLLHGHAQKVLVIGMGSGVTFGEAARYPVLTLDCVEIDPAVVEAARLFAAYNGGVHGDPRARIFVADGRNFLLASQDRYDVIISEPSNPWIAGLGYLFTKEFYELAKQRLASGGVVCQWLQLYQLAPADVKLMLRTFHEAFPYVSVWSSIPGDFLLVGSLHPQQVPYEVLAARMQPEGIRRGLKVVRVDRPDVLLESFWLGPREVEAVTADSPWVHEDDLPWLEFDAPKAMFRTEWLALNYDGLRAFRTGREVLSPGAEAVPRDAAFYEALGRVQEYRGQWQDARDTYQQALQLAPGRLDAQLGLARALLKRQQDAAAQDVLLSAVSTAPDQPDAYWLLGQLAWQQQRTAEARRWFERAGALRPPSSPEAELLGDCASRETDWLSAAEYYRSAVAQGGGDRWPLLEAYGKALKQAGRGTEAEAVWRAGLTRFPQEAAFPILLGELTLGQPGRLEEAAAFFQQARRLMPGSPAAWIGLGRVALERRQPQEARRLFREALRYNPYHLEALQLLQQLSVQGRPLAIGGAAGADRT